MVSRWRGGEGGGRGGIGRLGRNLTFIGGEYKEKSKLVVKLF